jgi:hypothetical protein
MLEGISLDLLNLPKPMRARFLHHGNSTVRNSLGRVTTFSHEAIQAIFEVANDGSVISDGLITRGQTSDFVGVSPFAVWTIKIDGKTAGALQSLGSLWIVLRGRSYVTT